MYKVGDKVWFIKSVEEICWRQGRFKPPKLSHPQQKKITQVVRTKDNEVLYQVKGCHFSEEMVGVIVFKIEADALQAMQGKQKY